MQLESDRLSSRAESWSKSGGQAWKKSSQQQQEKSSKQLERYSATSILPRGEEMGKRKSGMFVAQSD